MQSFVLCLWLEQFNSILGSGEDDIASSTVQSELDGGGDVEYVISVVSGGKGVVSNVMGLLLRPGGAGGRGAEEGEQQLL